MYEVLQKKPENLRLVIQLVIMLWMIEMPVEMTQIQR
jgi:hypothetical protein